MIDEAAPPEIADLLEAAATLSRRFGEDREYARAGGGNSSVKDGSTLYIKPSGMSLGSIRASSLMPLAIEPLRALAATGGDAAPAGSDPVMRVAMAARLRDEGDRRPSVECVFHALIPRRFVIHTHPTAVNALTCAVPGATIAAELFGDDVTWVPYVDPGLPLALEIDRRRRDRTPRADAEAMLLQNHGLIVAADEPGAVVERSEALVAAIRDRLAATGTGRAEADAVAESASAQGARAAPVAAIARVVASRLQNGGGPVEVVVDRSADALRLASTAEGKSLATGGALTPDQVVYAGSWPLWVDLDRATDDADIDRAVATALDAHLAAHDERPVVAVVRDVGVLATGPTHAAAETARDLYLDATRVGFGALALGGVRPLAPAERTFIAAWEAEAYRRGIAVR